MVLTGRGTRAVRPSLRRLPRRIPDDGGARERACPVLAEGVARVARSGSSGWYTMWYTSRRPVRSRACRRAAAVFEAANLAL